MKNSSLMVLCAGLVLAGCVKQETFVKQNMRYSDFELDRSSCETKATQEVETNRSPGAEIVTALFTGYYAVQDANAPARERNYEACMLAKGYQRIELPPCKDMNDARDNGTGPLNARERVQITSESCATADQSGRIIFHTEGTAS